MPLFVAVLTDTFAYQCLEIFGTIFFAISGLVLARKYEFTLMEAFILAILPSLSGGLLRDIILSREPVVLLKTPLYINRCGNNICFLFPYSP